MSDESLAELLDGTVLFPLRFPFGQVLAETIGDVCTDECLIAFEANRRGDLPLAVDNWCLDLPFDPLNPLIAPLSQLRYDMRN